MDNKVFNPEEHMIDLKGKDYLEVKWRLVWFRSEHPLYAINTEVLELDENHAIFRATVADENGRQISCGTGSESIKDFREFIEKAETKAIGRALAVMGYGTQFAPELEEGDRIVDAPVDRKKQKEQQTTNKPSESATDEQKAFILKSIFGKAKEDTVEKYGSDLERLSCKTAEKLIARIKEVNPDAPSV